MLFPFLYFSRSSIKNRLYLFPDQNSSKPYPSGLYSPVWLIQGRYSPPPTLHTLPGTLRKYHSKRKSAWAPKAIFCWNASRISDEQNFRLFLIFLFLLHTRFRLFLYFLCHPNSIIMICREFANQLWCFLFVSKIQWQQSVIFAQ